LRVESDVTQVPVDDDRRGQGARRREGLALDTSISVPRPSRLARAFELGGSDSRFLPMEGLRGVAVGLVFLQHYCTQLLIYDKLEGFTAHFALFFRDFGNYGVDLFFVLSGFLIYSILLRRRPGFFDFMARRAQRLYPAFLAAFFIAISSDFLRPEPKIPSQLTAGAEYLAANLFFLPGLLPINPLFTVNWSLSYEWWFYVTATILFSVLGLATLAPRFRVAIIVFFSTVLLSLSAAAVPHVPTRGLCLFGGMLLAEAKAAELPSLPGVAAAIIALAAFVVDQTQPVTDWMHALLLAIGFCAICSAALGGRFIIARPLTWRPLRWFGNMSYSYYLVHGFAVVAVLRPLMPRIEVADVNLLFWMALPPVFAASLCVGAALFLFIERPFSLDQKTH
jgi:exopolysaccharide production protein ExoZ